VAEPTPGGQEAEPVVEAEQTDSVFDVDAVAAESTDGTSVDDER
jgi:hypothetical protein